LLLSPLTFSFLRRAEGRDHPGKAGIDGINQNLEEVEIKSSPVNFRWKPEAQSGKGIKCHCVFKE